ncbi:MULTISPECIES: EAL domain-containing response regulator [Halomonadaceae]|uniref:EAL domain-containing response regulator n=1 Tax=Billgrantia aerodenitrificans TaxID=2733483 RepID=A0ABS9AVE5_9GAMM|nr:MULTISPECIES: EAL domain-containing response regulator [Halomonas]MCE8025856.1 EAL domain-containing response regulator [Halomonas aerodenitrificans]
MHMERMLIFEHDSQAARSAARIAEDVALKVRVAQSIEGFRSALIDEHPDCVLIDLTMPGTDGLDIIRLMAKRECNANVILTSGADPRLLEAAARIATARGLRVIGHLTKPFPSRGLSQMLRQKGGAVPTTFGPVTQHTLELSFSILRQAIENCEFTLAYQPQVRCRDGQLAGFEALARWQHPDGLIAPSRFIPAVERAGLMPEFTARMTEQALSWFRKAILSPPTAYADVVVQSPPTLSINISALNLTRPDFPDVMAKLCEKHSVDSSQVVLELTETAALDDPVLSLELLTRLRAQGFQLSIDDFGAGYSSMQQLVRLPFSEIKIDKAFVASALQSDTSRSVVKSIVELGHSLGLRSTAEGVEDEATLQFLDFVGCDLAQGYFIARPMAGEQLSDWLSSVSEWPFRAMGVHHR